MNANLNEIFKLVNPANTIGANRFIAHAVGASEAMIYSALLAKSAYYEEHGMISDGWFFSTVADLEESTTFSEKQQRRAINNLIKSGLIHSERRGMPAKRFFKINGDLDNLREIILRGEKIIAEKFGKEKIKARENTDIISVENYEDYYKSESRKMAFQSAPRSSAEMSEQEPSKVPNKFRQNAAVPYKTKNNNHNKKSSSVDDDEIRKNFLSVLKKNICYDELCRERSNDRKIIDDMLEIMLDVICSKKEKVRVNGDNKAVKRVSEIYLKLNKSHFLSALDAIRSNPNPVFNRRGYIITVLYNSFSNVNSIEYSVSPKTTFTANSQKSSFDTDELMKRIMAKYARN